MSTTRKLLFAITTVLMVMVFVESVLFLAGFQYDSTKVRTDQWIEFSNQALAQDGWFKRLQAIGKKFETDETPDWFLEYDPQLLWRTRRPNIAFSINEQGFRGATVPIPKPLGEFRILVLGDSVVWGYKADIRETWCYLLENHLNEGQEGTFRVINAGVPGYSSEQGRLYFLHELSALTPDLVIISFGRNDRRYKPEEWQGLTDRQLIEKRIRSNQIIDTLKHLRSYQFIEYITPRIQDLLPDALKPAREPYPEFTYHNVEMDLDNSLVRVPEDDFRANILAMLELTSRLNAHSLIITVPINPEVVGNYNDVLRDLSRESAVPFIDMDSIFRSKHDYLSLLIDECHLTPQGHILFADNVLQFLVPHPEP